MPCDAEAYIKCFGKENQELRLRSRMTDVGQLLANMNRRERRAITLCRFRAGKPTLKSDTHGPSV